MDRVLFRLGQQGLARLSPAAVTELSALAQTAHHAGMVRVERELGALATQVGRYLDRDPLYDDRRAMAVLNQTWLLNRAARSAWATGRDPADLTAALGELRRSYAPVEGRLEVQALGAHGWVTDSDFVGITVMFRGPDVGLLQVANARPCVYFGREPLRLLRMPISETLGMTVQELSHGAFVFESARRSADGRLSVHADLRVTRAPWRGAAYAGRTASTWDALVELLRAEIEDGDGRGCMALVEPAGWGPMVVDEARSEARMELLDAVGARLTARVALRAENNLLVDNLQRLAHRPELRPPALFGRVTSVGGLAIEPWTAVYGVPVRVGRRGELKVEEVHLGLEDLDGLRIGA